ncbi:MAG TPA: DUF1801 domain-containing protein, partial [Naasia sp.]
MTDVQEQGDSRATAEEFTAEERAAMKQRAAELRKAKSRAKGAGKAAADLQDVLDAIAAMEPADRAIAERLHAIVTATAPELAPKTWYGFPAYARDGKIVAFYQPAAKFKTRYPTLGFNDEARLDDGTMWPTAYAITEMTDAN